MHCFWFVSVILFVYILACDASANQYECKTPITITKTERYKTLTFCENRPHKKRFYKEVLVCDKNRNSVHQYNHGDCPKRTVTCTPATTIQCTSTRSLTSRTTTTTTITSTSRSSTITKTTTTTPKTSTTLSTNTVTSTSRSTTVTSKTSTTITTSTSTSISTISTSTTTTSTSTVTSCCKPENFMKGPTHAGSYGGGFNVFTNATSPQQCCIDCFNTPTCFEWVFFSYQSPQCYFGDPHICDNYLADLSPGLSGGIMRCSDGCIPNAQ